MVSAQTIASASPYWYTFVSLRIGRSQPSASVSSGNMTRPLMRFLPLTSLWVTTLKTPGIFSASPTSMERMLACDTLAWTTAHCSVPGGILYS